jgi:hypothetical protein
MKKWILFIGVVAVSASGFAGSYSQDLGDGTTIASSTGHAQVYEYGERFTALRLTQGNVVWQFANFALPDLDAGHAITSFTATFDSLIFSRGEFADGFSFNFGFVVPGFVDKDGMSFGQRMLSIVWDTYSADDGRGIEVFVDGSSVSRSEYDPILQDQFFEGFTGATIVWDESGLDVVYNGSAIFTDLDVPYFIAMEGDRFAFASTTGEIAEDVFIDNVSVETVPEPATAVLMAFVGGLGFLIRRHLVR